MGAVHHAGGADGADEDGGGERGFYHSDVWQREYPKIQIRTVGELLAGQGFELPARLPSYEGAQRHREEGEQGRLG